MALEATLQWWSELEAFMTTMVSTEHPPTPGVFITNIPMGTSDGLGYVEEAGPRC